MVINMKYEKQSKHFRGTAPLLTYYTEEKTAKNLVDQVLLRINHFTNR